MTECGCGRNFCLGSVHRLKAGKTFVLHSRRYTTPPFSPPIFNLQLRSAFAWIIATSVESCCHLRAPKSEIGENAAQGKPISEQDVSKPRNG